MKTFKENLLSQDKRKIAFYLLSAVVGAAVMIYFTYNIKQWSNNHPASIAINVIQIIIIIAVIWKSRQLITDLFIGKKDIIRGIVEDRISSTAHCGTRSSESFEIKIGEQCFTIDMLSYNKVKTGDLVEVSYSELQLIKFY